MNKAAIINKKIINGVTAMPLSILPITYCIINGAVKGSAKDVKENAISKTANFSLCFFKMRPVDFSRFNIFIPFFLPYLLIPSRNLQALFYVAYKTAF